MSNAQAKAERSKAKDIRQGVAPQKENPERGKKKQKDRPWRVLTVWIFSKTWWCCHRSKTKEAAEKWIAKSQRSYGGHKTDDQYRIEGPEE